MDTFSNIEIKRKPNHSTVVFQKKSMIYVDELFAKYEDFLKIRKVQILDMASEFRQELLTKEREQRFNEALLQRCLEVFAAKQKPCKLEKQATMRTKKPKAKHIFNNEVLEIRSLESLETANAHNDFIVKEIPVVKELSRERVATQKQKEGIKYKREVFEYTQTVSEIVDFSITSKPTHNLIYLADSVKKETYNYQSAPTISQIIEFAKTELQRPIFLLKNEINLTKSEAKLEEVVGTEQLDIVAQTEELAYELVQAKELACELAQTETLAYELVSLPEYSFEKQVDFEETEIIEPEINYEISPAMPELAINGLVKVIKVEQKQRLSISNVFENKVVSPELDELAYKWAKGARGIRCYGKDELQNNKGRSLRGDSEHPMQDLYVLKNEDGSVIEGTYLLFGKSLLITEDKVRYAGNHSVSGLDENDRTAHIDLNGLNSILYNWLEEKGLNAVCKSMLGGVYFKTIESVFEQYKKVHPDSKMDDLGILIVEVDPVTGKLSEPGYNPETGLQYTPRAGEHYAILITDGSGSVHNARIDVSTFDYRSIDVANQKYSAAA